MIDQAVHRRLVHRIRGSKRSFSLAMNVSTSVWVNVIAFPTQRVFHKVGLSFGEGNGLSIMLESRLGSARSFVRIRLTFPDTCW